VNRKSNLKVVEEKPERLTAEQIEALIRDITRRSDDERLLNVVLLLADELTRFCDDASHVETIGIHVGEVVFARSALCGEAQARHAAELRAKLQKGGTR
jgi:hypothetical protein